MFVHLPSGVVFENRKQAVICMGKARYVKALSDRQFYFNNEEK